MADPDSLPLRGNDPARCDKCGFGNLDINFGCRLSEIAWVQVGKEMSSLSDFPINVICPACGHCKQGTGHAFTIDVSRGVITEGHVRMPDAE
jgi:hypothetical protein